MTTQTTRRTILQPFLFTLLSFLLEPSSCWVAPRRLLIIRTPPLPAVQTDALRAAGDALVSAAQSDSSPLARAGESLVQAAEEWGAAEASWEQIAEQFAACSEALLECSAEGRQALLLAATAISEEEEEAAALESALAWALEAASAELGDASEVTGCMSIAPPAAAPNLIAAADELATAARILASPDPSEDSSVSSRLLQAAASLEAFAAVAEGG